MALLRMKQCILFFSLLITCSFSEAPAAIIDKGFEVFKEQLNSRFGEKILNEALEHPGIIDPALIHNMRALSAQDATFIIDQIEQVFTEELSARFAQKFQEEIVLLIAGSSRQRLEKAAHIADSLVDAKKRNQLFFQLYKTLVYLREIPGFSKGSYLDKQSLLLELAADLLWQEEHLPPNAHPTTPNHPDIFFVFDPAKTAFPFPIPPYDHAPYPEAVFKAPRNKEIAIWELACLFELNEVVVPSIQLFMQGQKGALQVYQKNDVAREKLFHHGLYGWITFSSYIQSALAILLFAIDDVHTDNMSYQLTSHGYLNIALLDTEFSLTKTNTRSFTTRGLFSIATPFRWIGWDYPQVDKELPHKESQKILQIAQNFLQRIEDFYIYLENPLTSLHLTSDQAAKLRWRASSLHQMITAKPKHSALHWLGHIFPPYLEAQQKLHKFFPKEGTSYVLFQLSWTPETVYNLLSKPKKRKEFAEWLSVFAQSSNP